MTDYQFKTGFIGAGNMAQSLIGGMINHGFKKDLIHASEPQDAPCKKLRALGIECTDSNIEVASWAEVIILAVKPQVLKPVVMEIARTVGKPGKLLVSIAAGVRTDSIARWLGSDMPIVRVMPNTPALLGKGVSGLIATAQAGTKEKNRAQAVFDTVGTTLWFDHEDRLDAVTAVSGSGPAYFFLLMEAMINAAVEQGLTADQASTLVLQTAAGSAAMALSGDEKPAALRQRVTSPGGTTERAIDTFMQGNFPDLVSQAIAAACRRSRELSDEADRTN